VRRRVATCIDELAAEPRPPGVIEVKGRLGVLRIRAADYRIEAVALLVVLAGRAGGAAAGAGGLPPSPAPARTPHGIYGRPEHRSGPLRNPAAGHALRACLSLPVTTPGSPSQPRRSQLTRQASTCTRSAISSSSSS
jgi:hypothetical protein